MTHPIPAMTDPLGRHWKQPRRDQIEIDCNHALMPRSAFDQLLEYSATTPSGTYPGKMWKAHLPDGRGWALRWYGPSYKEDEKEYCSNNQKLILIVEGA